MNFLDDLLPIDGRTPSIDTVVALGEDSKDQDQVKQENNELGQIVRFVTEKFHRAKSKRMSDETRWVDAYRNYRGLYNAADAHTTTEKSKSFIKITKTKVNAAYAQIVDVLFAGNKFPIGIEPSPVPEGVLESVHFDPKAPKDKTQDVEAPKKDNPINSVIRRDILEMVGLHKETLSRVEDKLQEGPGKTPTSYTWEPALDAARQMEKLIHDQLSEANASKSLRSFAFDMSLFGTGIYKGPFAKNKEYASWDESGKYKPQFNTIPDVNYVSIWDAYPDPDGRSTEDCEFFIERHRMNRAQLRDLKRHPNFRKESIELAILQGPDYIEEYWESMLQDNSTNGGENTRYEVLEYWGILDKELAEEAKIELPEELEDMDQIQVNIWVCNDYLLRVVLNPFTPMRLPYMACPYEVNPYSFFGVGVGENMSDTQSLMNGYIRLANDNAALSSNIIFEIDETNLVPGQTMELFPGKVFRRQGGQPGQSVTAIKFPNVTQEVLMLFDKARQLADESTGIPSYSHGQSGIQSTGRTAAGMSMLMGAAAQNIKAVVRNIDDYLLVPLGKSMFSFNMQFNFDKKYLGDLEIVARGTESLMRNEVRSQKLLQFYQMTANPMDVPYTKRDYILRELAISLDLDPDKVVNDPREAGIQAEMIAENNRKMGIQPNQPGMGGQGGPPSVNDPTQTGGGNIGPGAAPPPGAAGYTGGGGGDNGGDTTGQGQV